MYIWFVLTFWPRRSKTTKIQPLSSKGESNQPDRSRCFSVCRFDATLLAEKFTGGSWCVFSFFWRTREATIDTSGGGGLRGGGSSLSRKREREWQRGLATELSEQGRGGWRRGWRLIFCSLASASSSASGRPRRSRSPTNVGVGPSIILSSVSFPTYPPSLANPAAVRPPPAINQSFTLRQFFPFDAARNRREIDQRENKEGQLRHVVLVRTFERLFVDLEKACDHSILRRARWWLEIYRLTLDRWKRSFQCLCHIQFVRQLRLFYSTIL